MSYEVESLASEPLTSKLVITKRGEAKMLTFEQFIRSHGRDVAKLDADRVAGLQWLYDSLCAGTLVGAANIQDRIDAICGSLPEPSRVVGPSQTGAPLPDGHWSNNPDFRNHNGSRLVNFA